MKQSLHTPDKKSSATGCGAFIDLNRPGLARMLGHLPQLISVTDLDGQAVSLSQSWLDYTGTSRDALLGPGWAQFIHPDDRALAWGRFEQAQRAQGSLTTQLRIKAGHDGQWHWWVCRGRLVRDAHGQPLQWLWLCSDIDAQMRATQKARIDEERTKLVLDRTPLIGIRIDAQDRIQAASGKGLGILGRTEAELLGFSIWDLTRSNPPLAEAFGKASRGERTRLELAIRGEDWQIFIAPEQDSSGRQIGMLGLALRVTERNRLAHLAVSERAARETAAVKSQFLANMSHEVRTPLAGVLGAAELLCDMPLSDKQRQYVKIIQASGRGLLHVIDDILSFSHAHRSSETRELTPFEPRRVLLNQVEMMRSLAIRKDLQLTTQVHSGVPDVVLGDISRINQVLLNFLSNAIKFTHSGSIDLSASVHKETRLCFSVRDTGIGLNAQAKAKIFKPFVQASNQISGQYGGTGLGLSISRDLILTLGGDVGVDSTPGLGSHFWFDLPLVLPQKDATASLASDAHTAESPPPRAPAAFGPQALILIVEDNRTNQILLSRQLAKMGFESAIANHGEEALAMLQAQHYDLILMDCQMPVMDGYQATEAIRRREATEATRVPIIAVTANVLEADQMRCRDAGMDAYLAKPYKREELAALMQQWLPQMRDGQSAQR